MCYPKILLDQQALEKAWRKRCCGEWVSVVAVLSLGCVGILFVVAVTCVDVVVGCVDIVGGCIDVAVSCVDMVGSCVDMVSD